MQLRHPATLTQPLYTAICNSRFKKRKELRTQEQPLIAEHRGWNDHARNDRSRNRRTQEVPFIAACSHFTRKNTRFRAPASSPTQAPWSLCNIHAVITMHVAASRSKPASLYAHGKTTWQQSCSHYTSVLLCDAKSHTTVSHHPSLSAFLYDAKSHTTLHWVYCYRQKSSVTRKIASQLPLIICNIHICSNIYIYTYIYILYYIYIIHYACIYLICVYILKNYIIYREGSVPSPCNFHAKHWFLRSHLMSLFCLLHRFHALSASLFYFCICVCW